MALKTFVTATDAIFTVADIDSNVIGASGGSQTVRIQGSTNLASGMFVDANIERIELLGALADYSFIVDGTLGFQIKNAAGNAVIANLNQNIVIAFNNGSATLLQASSNVFTLNGVTVNASTSVAASAISITSSANSTVTLNSVTPPANAAISKSFVTEASTIFTVADHKVDVLGGAGSQIVRIQAGVTGVTLDANIERVELSGALATYKFVAIAGTGLQIQNVSGSLIVATLASINQNVEIAFTDGSATLVQGGTTAFTLNTVALAVSPTAAATPDLTGHALVTTAGEHSALGLIVSNATGNNTVISGVFDAYLPTSGTSGTVATVVATSMDSDQLNAVAAKATASPATNKIADLGITGVMALTSGQTAAQLTSLFSKDDTTPDATVVATGMTDQVAVLATNVGKIADVGITGLTSLTGAQFTTLTAKLASSATLTVVTDITFRGNCVDSNGYEIS